MRPVFFALALATITALPACSQPTAVAVTCHFFPGEWGENPDLVEELTGRAEVIAAEFALERHETRPLYHRDDAALSVDFQDIFSHADGVSRGTRIALFLRPSATNPALESAVQEAFSAPAAGIAPLDCSGDEMAFY